MDEGDCGVVLEFLQQLCRQRPDVVSQKSDVLFVMNRTWDSPVQRWHTSSRVCKIRESPVIILALAIEGSSIVQSARQQLLVRDRRQWNDFSTQLNKTSAQRRLVGVVSRVDVVLELCR